MENNTEKTIKDNQTIAITTPNTIFDKEGEEQ